MGSSRSRSATSASSRSLGALTPVRCYRDAWHCGSRSTARGAWARDSASSGRPATFELDDDGIALVVDAEGDTEEKIVLAVKGCPTGAISVWRDDERIV